MKKKISPGERRPNSNSNESSSWAEGIRLKARKRCGNGLIFIRSPGHVQELKKKKEELKTATEEISKIKVQFTGLIESFGFKMTDSTLDGLVRKAEAHQAGK